MRGPLLLSVALIILLPLLIPVLLPADPSAFPEFGENDFVQYWAAYQLAERGADPFDPRLVMAVERARGWSEARPLMMWNPPWLLAVLAPVLLCEFDTAARAFLGLNIALIVSTVLICLKLFSVPKRLWLGVIALSPLFFPLYLTLRLGQTSIVLTFFASLMLLFCRDEKYFAMGIVLGLMTVKLQFLYLLAAAVMLVVPMAKWTKVLLGAAFTLTLLLAATYALSPDALLHWLTRSKHEIDPMLDVVFSWKTTTLSTIMRIYFFNGKAQSHAGRCL